MKTHRRAINFFLLSCLLSLLTKSAWAITAIQVTKLLASDGAATSLFGSSVSVSGDTAVIGAFGDDDNGFVAGSAYVFTCSSAVWTQQAKLIASDGADFDRFGLSVSISGDTAVIGALLAGDNSSRPGAAYVFIRSGAVWTEQAKLTALDRVGLDRFGASVSISGDTAVIGATGDDDNGSRSGSAYVFTRSGAVWTEQAKLTASDGAIDDEFGFSVSISGNTAVIGARLDGDNGVNSGSAYVFSLIPAPIGIPIISPWALVGLVGLLAWLGARKLSQ